MNGISNKKITYAAVGFIVLNLAVLLGGGWFLTSKIISSSAQLAREKGMLEATQENWQQISHSQKELQTIKPQLAKIDEAFVPKNEPIGFINLLESLAQRTDNVFGINLTSQTPDPKKKEDFLLFQINLTGKYSNLMHFLNYLQNMKYRVQIQSLDVSAYGEGAAQTSEGKQIPHNSVYSIINLKALTK